MGTQSSSTNARSEDRTDDLAGQPPWRAAGRRYYALNDFLRQRFGQAVHKVSVDAGFTCPNVDGTVAVGGCTFCDNRSFSPSRRLPRTTITGQIDEGIRHLVRRYRARRYLAYFQPATNTYAPVERLRRVYAEALAHPLVLGLAIGTRPDCLSDDVLSLIDELAATHYVSLELGLQTMHDRSLVAMNRGHLHAATVEAVGRMAHRRFELCAHLMLGLPGESRDDMLATAVETARLGFDAVKLHNLYVVRGTPWGDDYLAGRLPLLERGAYVSLVVDVLERLPSNCVIERTSGDAPPDFFLGPAWSTDKPGLRAAIDAEFLRRDTWQGKLLCTR